MADKTDLATLNEMLVATDMPPMTYEEYEEFEAELARFEEEEKDLPPVEPTIQFKRDMNRLFREQVGSKKIPHPEADNAFERFHSWAVVSFHLKPYDPKNKRRKRKT